MIYAKINATTGSKCIAMSISPAFIWTSLSFAFAIFTILFTSSVNYEYMHQWCKSKICYKKCDSYIFQQPYLVNYMHSVMLQSMAKIKTIFIIIFSLMPMVRIVCTPNLITFSKTEFAQSIFTHLQFNYGHSIWAV